MNLLIARALNRGREIAIRSALGASRGRLLQYLMVESGVLTASAAIVGLGVAGLAVRLVTVFGVGYVPRVEEVTLSGASLGWLAALAIASGLLILVGGLVPSIHGGWRRMDSALRSGGRSATDGPAARRLRRALVSAEFALATPLIVAAVLVMLSLDRLSQVSVGIDTERVLTGGVSLSGPAYAETPIDRPSGTARSFGWRRCRASSPLRWPTAARLQTAATATTSISKIDRPRLDRISRSARGSPCRRSFSRRSGLALDRGRLLDEFSLRDDVVVVDRAWANRFFPGEEVLGRRFRSGGCTTCPWTTVVGVVGNVKWTGLDATEDGTVYWPHVDRPNAYVVLRAAGDPSLLTTALRGAVRELDPSLALSNVATGDDLVAGSLSAPRYLSVLVGMFALAALVLSVVGVYGVMAYFVEQHTRDIGIRLALGGEPSDVRRMVVLQGLRLVAVGVALGVGASFLTARLLTTVLFDVSATDVPTMAAVPVALVTMAALACLVPGRRAARLDPAEILREC